MHVTATHDDFSESGPELSTTTVQKIPPDPGDRIAPEIPEATHDLAPPALVRSVARISGSIVLGLSAGLVQQILTIGFLGWLGREALYIRSVYTPMGFFILAVTEGFMVAAQVSAGISARQGRTRDALSPIGTHVAIGAAVLLTAALAFAGASGPILRGLNVAPGERSNIVTFVVTVSATSAASLLPYLGAAVLRGVGRPGLASLLVAGSNAVSVVGMVVVHATTGLGALSVPLGGIPSTCLGTAAALILLRRAGIAIRRPFPHPGALTQLRSWALPVSITMLLLSFVNFGYLRALRNAGTAQVAAFNLGQMAVACAMVGALAIGSGAAIAVNLVPGDRRARVNLAGLYALLRIALPVYAAVGCLIYLLRDQVADLLASDAEISRLTADYLAWIAPTLFLFGGTLAILAFLEQIGRGSVALVLNALYFAVLLGAALALPQPVGSHTLAKLLAAGNAIGFWTLAVSVRIILRERRSPARSA